MEILTPNSTIKNAFTNGAFCELAFMEAPIGLVVTQSRVIRHCNYEFAQMFGYEPEELIQQSFVILYPSDEEFIKIRDKGVQDLRTHNRYWDERIMARKDGSLFWCRVRGRSFTPEEPLKRAVWSMADISDIRPYQPLTTRERQIVMMLGEGQTSKEIARLLKLSYRTIEVYRSRLLKKFGASNSTELLSCVTGASNK